MAVLTDPAVAGQLGQAPDGAPGIRFVCVTPATTSTLAPDGPDVALPVATGRAW
ncbi:MULTISPECIES: hypothetical protein [unclassified Streptomyces]|uniref:hypothetical protein n=1 Tax=unclassified Streptomyces TaxID=2593676 RepID=UPI002E35C510|nr:hypothetical protein [Streptomyces sp. NBC_01428]